MATWPLEPTNDLVSFLNLKKISGQDDKDCITVEPLKNGRVLVLGLRIRIRS